MLTLITPTGARPAAFALCENYMARQTYTGAVRWIIVDDGAPPARFSVLRDGWARHIIRPDPPWRPGENTQGRNLKAAIGAARSLAEIDDEDLQILIIEDDDWYHPAYLEKMAEDLRRADLVGEGDARAYNVRHRRWIQLRNREHASLHSTAMRGAAIDAFEAVLARPALYYDLNLWRAAPTSRRIAPRNFSVGIKGMAGRPGLARGHGFQEGSPDPSGEKLIEWIGAEDAAAYAPFFDEQSEKRMKTLIYVGARPMTYRTRRLIAGQEFEAHPRHERWLLKSGRAVLPEEKSSESVESARRPPAPADETADVGDREEQNPERKTERLRGKGKSVSKPPAESAGE